MSQMFRDIKNFKNMKYLTFNEIFKNYQNCAKLRFLKQIIEILRKLT